MLCACGGAHYFSSYDRAFDFDRASTFTVARTIRSFEPDRPETRIMQRSPLFVKLLHEGIARELMERGWHPRDAGHAELAFTFRTEVTWGKGLSPAEIRFKKGTVGSLYPEANPRGRNFGERSVTIYAVDMKSRDVVWQSTAENLSPEFYESPDGLRSVLRKLFSGFPEK